MTCWDAVLLLILIPEWHFSSFSPQIMEEYYQHEGKLYCQNAEQSSSQTATISVSKCRKWIEHFESGGAVCVTTLFHVLLSSVHCAVVFCARYFVCKILCLTLNWTFSTLAYEISLISCPNEMKLCKNHLYSKGSGMWLRDTNRNKRLFVAREMHYLLSAYSQKSPKINPILRSGQILPALLFTLTESLAKTETDTGFQRKPASNSGQILAGHVNESKFVPWNPRTVKLMPCFRDTDSVLLLVTTVW